MIYYDSDLLGEGGDQSIRACLFSIDLVSFVFAVSPCSMVAGVGDFGRMSVVMCSDCAVSVRLQCPQGVLFKVRVRLIQIAKVMPSLAFDYR